MSKEEIEAKLHEAEHALEDYVNTANNQIAFFKGAIAAYKQILGIEPEPVPPPDTVVAPVVQSDAPVDVE